MNIFDRSKVHEGLGRRLASILFLIGLVWLGFMMVNQIDSFSDVLPSSWSPFITSLFLLSLSLVLPGLTYRYMLGSYHDLSSKSVSPMGLYFSGQLLKYVPGRIWGIVYQISRSNNEIPAWTITRVSIDHTIFIMTINLIFSVVVLGIKNYIPGPISVIGLLIGFLALALYMLGGASNLISIARRLMPGKRFAFLDAHGSKSLTTCLFLKLVLIQFISIVLFALSWKYLDLGYTEFTNVDFILLGMLYVIASVIGIVTMVTPAGLGVREASFVTLASGLASISELAFIAVIARVWLLFAEVLSSLLVLFFVYALSLKRVYGDSENQEKI